MLKQKILEFYQKLYKTVGPRNFQPVLDQCPSPVNEEMNKQMLENVTMEEVKEAVFQLGALKASGPDGLNGHFYQHFWEELKHEVFQLVQQFFATGTFDPTLNQTHISLIPKVKHSESITQFRPISLCNFNYKIIAKVLANRLKRWLPDLITPEQSAFVQGRQIQDNIFIVQEVIHQLKIKKRKKRFQAILKLDMQKAYDRVEWDFLKACLLKTGFHTRWVSMIMHYVTTATFSVKVNGEPMEYFSPTRGLRQGDPLSPYLFVLVSNVLSWLMHKSYNRREHKRDNTELTLSYPITFTF